METKSGPISDICRSPSGCGPVPRSVGTATGVLRMGRLTKYNVDWDGAIAVNCSNFRPEFGVWLAAADFYF